MARSYHHALYGWHHGPKRLARQTRAFTRGGKAPFVWHMVQYCLELPYGKFRHFPAGTYNEQVKDKMGKLELQLISIVHSVWYAFKYSSMSEWGDAERQAAKLAEPVQPKPEKPTRRIDELVRRLWPASWWLHRIVWELRKVDG